MPEKDYVWGVVCTLEYEWVSNNLTRIRAARHAHRQNTVVTKPPDIVLSDFWKEALMAVAFDPRKFCDIFAGRICESIHGNFSIFN